MKKLIAGRITLVMDKGAFKEGVIVYKVNDKGVISREKALGVKKEDLKSAELIDISKRIIKHAENLEGINE